MGYYICQDFNVPFPRRQPTIMHERVECIRHMKTSKLDFGLASECRQGRSISVHISFRIYCRLNRLLSVMLCNDCEATSPFVLRK